MSHEFSANLHFMPAIGNVNDAQIPQITLSIFRTNCTHLDSKGVYILNLMFKRQLHSLILLMLNQIRLRGKINMVQIVRLIYMKSNI